MNLRSARCRWFPLISRVLLVLGVAGAGAVAQTATSGDPMVITNASPILPVLPGGVDRWGLPVRIEGVMLLGGRGKGVAVVEGASSPKVLRWADRTPVERGQRFVLRGGGVVEGSNVWFSAEPLIRNDGLHSMFERSAAVWLEAGDHPIRVRYFNAGGERGLTVLVEGPDIARQPVPDTWLFHRVTADAGASGGLDAGLRFQCFQGQWTELPEFDDMGPYTNGVSANFDVGVARRDLDFGIQFDGVVRVPQEGLYVFSCVSDDGSILRIGEHTNSVEIVGRVNLPPIEQLDAGELIERAADEFVAEMDGQVTFVSVDPGMLTLELTSGRGRALVEMPWEDVEEQEALIGAQIRAGGLVRSVFTAEGNRVAGRMILPWPEQLRLTDVPRRLWGLYPFTTVEQVLADPAITRPFTLFRLHGTITGGGERGTWLLRDATGQIPLVDSGGRLLQAGDRIEALGWCRHGPSDAPVLVGVTRALRMGDALDDPGELPLLDSIEKVKHMSREEAELGYPVKVRGVITLAWPYVGFFLQDATGSIDVRLPPSVSETQPKVGEYWEVEGVTFAEFAPNIRATRAVRLGLGAPPDVVRPTWDQLVDGSLDTQYVEIQGVASHSGGTKLSLLTRGGRLEVQLPEMAPTDLARVEGALVRVRGCVLPGRDTDTQRVRLGELELRNVSLAVDEPAPDDPFALPLRHAADLLLFDAHVSPIRRTRLQGILVQQHDGMCYLMDGFNNGVRMVPKQPGQWERGEVLEMVGFPDLNGPSPLLRDAVVQVVGKGQLPPPVPLTPGNLVDGALDSTFVAIKGTLLGHRQSGSEHLLELQTGPRIWMARMPVSVGEPPLPAVGSQLQLAGVYVGRGGDRPGARGVDSFELLVALPDEVTVLSEPSWWTVRRALLVAGVLAGILALAFGWITILRREVDQRTMALLREVEDHKRTEHLLQEKTDMLTREIEERVRMEAEVERGHRELLITSRLAGMAEVATSLLHNIGNVMTSVNVLGNAIVQHVRDSKVRNVARLGRLLETHRDSLGRFLDEDARGRAMPEYVQQLGAQLDKEQATLLDKVRVLNDNIQHINEIVAMQQAYAKVSGVLETVRPAEVVEDALRMHGESLKRHGIQLNREMPDLPPITLDRHKVLQILFNLLENAKHACLQQGDPNAWIRIRLERPEAGGVRIIVADNGVGIAPENLERIFSQGFSTRRDGHGLGLHSSVLAAQDMGGSLKGHSDGVGRGARFTLELPDLARTTSGDTPRESGRSLDRPRTAPSSNSTTLETHHANPV